jgi:preprotein translocase subunit SecF
MRLFDNLNIDFLGKRKIAYIISATVIILGIISLVVRGLQFGIDFKGGTEVGVEFEKAIEIGEIRENLTDVGLGNVEVKTFGGEQGVLVRTEIQRVPSDIFQNIREKIEEEMNSNFPDAQSTVVDTTSSSITYEFQSAGIASEVEEKMFEAGFQTAMASQEEESRQVVFRVSIADWIELNLKETYPNNPFTILKEEQVGPKIGEELKADAVIAIALSLIVILVYLGFRFKFVFAFGAVAALFHDVLITLGIFSLLYGWFDFLNLEISISVVAAFLTLVGYSINDTVVVFDRVREELKLRKTAPLIDNMNRAINITMRRTVVTSLTTLIVVAILLFFGGDVLRAFAFALFLGVLIGTYSSVFIASPVVLEYSTKRKSTIEF